VDLNVQEDEMSGSTNAGGELIDLSRIGVPGNVRILDDQHVEALAGSIALQGLLVPVVVRADGSVAFTVCGTLGLATAGFSIRISRRG
jgi:hypothetical protein